MGSLPTLRNNAKTSGTERDRARWRQLALMMLMACPTPILADTTDATAGSDVTGDNSAGGPQQLSEVVVYARRRTESIQDAPLAVSVRSAEQLKEQSADLAGDVGRDIPNVYMVSSPQSVNALNITMRGQSVTRSAIVFDSAVGVYVDGVYVADTQGAMSTLLDLDAVEVVRGSQGTLFGRNNTGGAVLFYTHKPDLTSYSAEVAISGGDYSEFMDRAIVNAPLDSTFGLRFAYQDNSRAGFGYSEGSGQTNLENQHRHTARAGALWKPSEGTEAYLTYEHFEAHEYGAILHPLPGTLIGELGQLFSSLPIPGLPVVRFPANPFVADGGLPGFDDARTDAVQLTVTQRLTDENVAKLMLGYRRLNASTALDVDASPVPFADTLLVNTANQTSAELQLSGTYTEQRFDWVGGLYWFQDHGSAPSVHESPTPGFLTVLQQVDALTGVDLTGDFPSTAYDQNKVVNISDAAYVHSEGHITRDWALAAGARYTRDEREIQENDFRNLPGVGESCTLDLNDEPLNGPCPDINKIATFHYWSWEVSTHYRLTDAWSPYARIGRSYRSGGWNTPLGSYNDVPYRPEQLTDYETGIKGSLLANTLVLAADAFYGQYDDMQRLLGILDQNSQPDTLVINAGRARVSGAEFEGQWRVLPSLNMHSSLAWTDGHYQSFVYTPVPGQPSVNLAGNSFSETPPYQASIGAQYEHPVLLGRIQLSADYAYQGKTQFNVINDFNYQAGYGTLNARIALTGSRTDWELALYGTNLTDEHFAYNGGTITAPPSTGAIFAWHIPAPPRMVAVEARYRWSMER
jgi:iron complex outermembrane receptor protein